MRRTGGCSRLHRMVGPGSSTAKDRRRAVYCSAQDGVAFDPPRRRADYDAETAGCRENALGNSFELGKENLYLGIAVSCSLLRLPCVIRADLI